MLETCRERNISFKQMKRHQRKKVAQERKAKRENATRIIDEQISRHEKHGNEWSNQVQIANQHTRKGDDVGSKVSTNGRAISRTDLLKHSGQCDNHESKKK
jgi:hypothetical protein